MQKRKKEGFALFFFTQLSFIIVYIIVGCYAPNRFGSGFMRLFRKKEAEDILLYNEYEDNEVVSDHEEEEPKKKFEWRKSLLVFAHDVMYLLALLVVFSLVLRVVVVKGTSMNDTLKDGDYLLILSNVFYRNPKQGDIIVVSKDTFDNGAPIVKRVIATEGQKVDIDFIQGIVYVDDVPLDEPYTLTPTNLYEGIEFPLIVDEGCLFVLGDNRNGSRDSRHPTIGLVDKREVIGKVIFLFIPGTNGINFAGEPNEPRDFSRIGLVN